MDTDTTAPRLIRRQELEHRTGYRRSTIYAAIKPGTKRFDPTFPQPVRLGRGAVAWVESEVDRWIESRMAQRAIQPSRAVVTNQSPLVVR